MRKKSSMTPMERRASLSLASIYGLRMLGMFIILPVFALYAVQLPGGANKTLVGLALGIYGLTQAVLQIPLGWLSDRIGRKPVIMGGLLVFALGSFVAASAHTLEGITVGRAIQGAGAIAAALIALTADLTSPENRTTAMAMIGVTIGLAFTASMALSPMLYPLIGVPGLFVLTGVLALTAIAVTRWIVPNPPNLMAMDRVSFGAVLSNVELLRLNLGIFVLHASLMATFMVVPAALVKGGLAQADHWKFYMPVMIASFILMVPPVAFAHGKWRKQVFLGGVVVVLLSHFLMHFALGQVWGTAIALTVFFTGFNVLEASLPSLVTLVAPPNAKGTATGVYSTIQFLGTFSGATLAGMLTQHFGSEVVPFFTAGLTFLWLVVAWPMNVNKPVVP
ncbi:MFS transporter [Ferrovum myxofaciens]|uniref:MFS transporter n=2 Tax=Ferrovum myxofaciens TaxID=416213 RepID=UPI002356BF7A|nr:MFS transporter [Ferrovum myxofaciens]